MQDELFSVEGKRVVITGGTSGIGKMITEGLAERGAHVFTASRKKPAVDALVEELSEKRGLAVGAVSMDLASPDGVEQFAAAAADHFQGSFDVLVNNAGATWGAPLEDYPATGWDRVFDLNVKSVFFLTQRSLPYLRKAAKAEDPARVVNIGSIAGMMHPPDNAWAYHPAKAAVHHLTETIAKALAGENITVNAIAPGIFPSKMSKHMFPGGDDSAVSSIIPMKRPGRPSDIVGTTIYLLSRAGAYTTGAILPVDGGCRLKDI
jgi:NAD(P)-dependent dehydrogenase (short-subunit alcohol dehydrogenase family)